MKRFVRYHSEVRLHKELSLNEISGYDLSGCCKSESFKNK